MTVSGVILIAFVMILSAGKSVADERSDRVIQSVLQDVKKYEQQFSRQPSPNPATVKRALKLLNLRRQSLDALPDHSVSNWMQADQRFNTLVEALNAYLSPVAPGPGPVQNKMTSESKAAVRADPAQSSKEMISHYRVRLKKLKRDMESVMDTLDRGGVKPFQDAAYVDKYEKLFLRFQQSLEKYSEFSGDPDVEAAKAALSKVARMLDFGKQQASKDLAELGDVQARLKDADELMHELKLPASPVLPLKTGQLKEWLLNLATLQKKAQLAAKPLPAIRHKAYLPNNRFTVQQGAAYDMSDLDRIQRGLNDVIKQSNEALQQFKNYLDINLMHAGKTLDAVAAYDPEDVDHRSSWFLGKGRAEIIVGRLKEAETLAAEAMVFSGLLGDADTQAKRKSMLARIRQIQADYLHKRKQALRLARMPKPVSNDAELLRIASETLKNPKYGVGKIQRLLINANKEHRSKETSEEKYDDVDVSLDGTVTLSGTKTTYHYEWDQFQVATAEPDEGKYYIFYNTLKYFTSGATTTPLNHWILSGRFQGGEILKENIRLSD